MRSAAALLGREPRVALGPATLEDVEGIARLINGFAERGLMLPKSEPELCRQIREYVVATDRRGTVLGCGGLRLYSRERAEIVGLAVDESCHGTGLGGALVDALLLEARSMGLGTVFALTLEEGFFRRKGFRTVPRTAIPEKLAADCASCFKREHCREVAVLRDLDASHGTTRALPVVGRPRGDRHTSGA